MSAPEITARCSDWHMKSREKRRNQTWLIGIVRPGVPLAQRIAQALRGISRR